MKLSFAQLEALLDELTERLFAEKLTVTGYIAEWDRVVDFAGWTWDEFSVEIDRRWTTIKKESSQLFKC